MAAYADYSYYRDDYRGQMGEDDFARLSIRASAYLDAATFRRIRGAWTEDAAVRDACCAVTGRLTPQRTGRRDRLGDQRRDQRELRGRRK